MTEHTTVAPTWLGDPHDVRVTGALQHDCRMCGAITGQHCRPYRRERIVHQQRAAS